MTGKYIQRSQAWTDSLSMESIQARAQHHNLKLPCYCKAPGWSHHLNETKNLTQKVLHVSGNVMETVTNILGLAQSLTF